MKREGYRPRDKRDYLLQLKKVIKYLSFILVKFRMADLRIVKLVVQRRGLGSTIQPDFSDNNLIKCTVSSAKCNGYR